MRLVNTIAPFIIYNRILKRPQPFPTDIDIFLTNLKLLTLSTIQLQELNTSFSLPEILRTINTLHNNKSPSPDGLTGEYYRQFKHILGPYLHKVYCHCLLLLFPLKC